tara:strand:- start:39598 stop:40302 length:705 start_codon:yes stop_codon:yes gene_type:complete
MKQSKRLIFKLRSVNKVYGETEAVNIGKLDIHPGTVYGIIGGVGSGKTTLLSLLSGYLQPTNGLLEYEDKSYQKNWLGKIKKNEDIFFAGRTGFYPRVSVSTIISNHFGKKKNVVEKRYFNKNNFQNIWSQDIETLSPGEAQWLGMIMAIESDPRVLMIDNYGIYFELGMENTFRNQLITMNRRLGTTILLASPDEAYLKKFCSVLVYLDNGYISRVRSGLIRRTNRRRSSNKK